ncbi:MAG: histidine triad nucleotide-binding protein [Elusimicrobia bacterium]|nr:histidine triad nucleotide-binding protein [Elusimicrobiota bacterium]
MNDCLFCKIIQGQIACQNVFSNDHCIAFKDINPQAPAHILIVPRRHIAKLSDVTSEDGELLGRLQLAAKEIAAQLKLESFRLVLNNGKMAGQSVDHIHYHLLGGRHLIWPPG